MAEQQKPFVAADLTLFKQKSVVAAESGKEQVAHPKHWCFSFRFWNTTDLFNVPASKPNWLVSVVERLRDLSRVQVDEFDGNPQLKRWYRYHGIDWTAKNVPIQRSEFKWVGKDYLDSPEDYPFMQFQISKGLGRIVGFWDEDGVFNILLFDPLHNIQPSKDFSYQVRSAVPVLACEYTTLLMELETAKQQQCESQTCGFHSAVQKVPSEAHQHAVLIIKLDEDTDKEARKLIESGVAKSMHDIIVSGVLAMVIQAEENKNG
jgi:hypothetical protein